MKFKYAVVDDFYNNPYDIRKYALSLDYPEPFEGYTYPGRNSTKSVYDQSLHNEIEKICGSKLRYPKSDTEAGYFRLSTENDTFEQYIHVDPGWDIAGVLYLNPPNQCEIEGGTSFWMHKKLGIEHCPRNPEEAALLGYDTYHSIRENLIYGDGLDDTKWLKYLMVPMKFNRLVLFDSLLWHSHNANFGDKKENARLVQLFFLKYA
jgi:hypothetical protein